MPPKQLIFLDPSKEVDLTAAIKRAIGCVSVNVGFGIRMQDEFVTSVIVAVYVPARRLEMSFDVEE